MKKIVYGLMIIVAAVSFQGCDDQLELGPIDYYGSGNFWNNKAQVESYMVGIHQDLRSMYQMFYYLGEARGGTLRLGTSSMGTSMDNEAPIKANTFTASSTGISNWYGIYGKLLQVNHFIQSVEEGCDFLTADEKGYYLGQAYGIRALYYFMLYRTYGGVPLELTVKVLGGTIQADQLYLARSTAEETLTQIKADINRSESSFGSATTVKSKYMWSPFATAMLKTQIYMWSAKVTTADHTATGKTDLQTAKTSLQKVMGGGYSLLSDFSKIFTQEANNEVIFALYFEREEATNWGHNFLYQPNDLLASATDLNGNPFTSDPLNLVTGGVMRHEYKESLVKSFESGDTRRGGTFFEYIRAVHGAAMKKLIGNYSASLGTRAYDSDIIIFRYADAILMMAEIENGLDGDPTAYVNQIRQRAYGSSYPVFVKGSFAENEKAILKERDKEFVNEGSRWFDLIRMQDAAKKSLVFSADANYPDTWGGTPEPVLTTSEAYMILWPIDVNVLNGDPLIEQNPGYGQK
ncbi:MAG: RagB/SusD family nutrient uptake outer membrane protein [Mangrovibacterium sp.]